MAKVLIAEDNPGTADLLREALEGEGHQVLHAETAPQAMTFFDGDGVDLAILDVGLKEGTGFEVCRHIRGHPQGFSTPVVMLTAQSELEDKRTGFDSGADYYLTKPLEVAELLLWVRALLRRAAADWTGSSVISTTDLSINPDARMVEVRGKLVRGLTAKEFNLLLELARARPRPVRREELLERVWGGSAKSNTLEVHVRSLREKLGALGAARVLTVKGVGYRLV